ncbi:MAG: hypothetical protein SGBAC_003999 [Bacillariaceae sp.]
MQHYNTNQGEPSEELPFDVERQSLPIPRPIRITSASRLDSTGLPVPPPPADSPPVTPVVSQPKVQAKTSNVNGSILLPSKPHKTPDDMFSSEYGEVKGDVYVSNNYKEEEGGDSSCTSNTSTGVEENSKQQMPVKTMFAIVTVLVVLLVIITVMVAMYFFHFSKTSEDVVPDAAQLPDWGIGQATFRPTQGPTSAIDLTLTPTQRPTSSNATSDATSNPSASPAILVAPSLPTLPPALNSVLITQTPTTSNPSTSPTRVPSLPTLPPALTSVLITKAPSVPTTNPTTAPNPPTLTPTSNPTNRPTQSPTLATPDPTAGLVPTSAPTQSPTNLFYDTIADFVQDDNADPAVQKAVHWLSEEADEAGSIPFSFDQKYMQRYGIIKLYFSVDPTVQLANSDTDRLPNVAMRSQDACSWRGMTCDSNGLLTAIKLSSRDLDGSLPADWGMFRNLKSIDFHSNKLKGSIPEGMYDISGLEEVFLYKNQLTGSISSKIGDLWSLKRFHLSHNRLSGSIPPELASTENRIRRIQYFNVHRNQMTGSIPSNMRLRSLYWMDLGDNQFSGEVPEEFGPESVRLRHLLLDHNKFSGTFPSSALNAGDGRLDELFINDNEFSGTFPGDHKSLNAIYAMTIQNNNFVAMERNSTCELDVFSGGELVEFKSKCLICRCGTSLMCEHCVL